MKRGVLAPLLQGAHTTKAEPESRHQQCTNDGCPTCPLFPTTAMYPILLSPVCNGRSCVASRGLRKSATSAWGLMLRKGTGAQP